MRRAKSIPAFFKWTIDKIKAESTMCPNNGCWLWPYITSSTGYGHIRHGGRSTTAHAVAYELFIGERVAPGFVIDHLCRERSCCNPAHLEAVTQRENLLRADTITAKNAAKTHCPKGHPFSGENLVVRKPGARWCRQCERESGRKMLKRIKDDPVYREVVLGKQKQRYRKRMLSMTPEERSEYLRRSREKTAEYRKRHPERILESTKKYRAKAAAQREG